MNRNLKISRILVYYDLPHVFTAKDQVEAIYLCLLVSLEEDGPKFIAVQVSKGRLISFCNGSLDLREIFEYPEIQQWYSLSTIEGNEQIFLADELGLDKLPDAYLPEKGFSFRNHDKSDDQIIAESLEYDNAIIHLAVSDDDDNYSIEADDLGDIVKLYQLILENTFKKELANRKVKDKKSYFVPNNYKLRAFATSQSSFNVHMYSTAAKDLFGNSIIECALEKLGLILSEFRNDDEYIDILRTVKGHSVSTLRKLVKKIVDDNLLIKHKWYSPSQQQVHYTKVNTENATKIYDILVSSEELAEETREFIGHLVQIDVDKGTWRIYNLEDEKEYPGESAPDKLQGLTVETVNYKIVCTEHIETMKVSEKEKIKYVLNSIDPVS